MSFFSCSEISGDILNKIGIFELFLSLSLWRWFTIFSKEWDFKLSLNPGVLGDDKLITI